MRQVNHLNYFSPTGIIFNNTLAIKIANSLTTTDSMSLLRLVIEKKGRASTILDEKSS